MDKLLEYIDMDVDEETSISPDRLAHMTRSVLATYIDGIKENEEYDIEAYRSFDRWLTDNPCFYTCGMLKYRKFTSLKELAETIMDDICLDQDHVLSGEWDEQKKQYSIISLEKYWDMMLEIDICFSDDPDDTASTGDPDESITKMIRQNKRNTSHPSRDEMMNAFRTMAESKDEALLSDPWKKRYHTLPSLSLDVERDDSDEYVNALSDAIIAITKGDYGSIDFKGFKIHYDDSPYVKSLSLDDGHIEYSHNIRFECDALSMIHSVEYHSEAERMAFLDPENDAFNTTLTLLDKVIDYLLDDGSWLKNKKTLNLRRFKGYSHMVTDPEPMSQDEINESVTNTFAFLFEDAYTKTTDLEFTEDDFMIIANVFRRMAFFTGYGDPYCLFRLDYWIKYGWCPKTKRNQYIWRCMRKFGQGDILNRLLDSCAVYYCLDNPQGWETVAYLLPIAALWGICIDPTENNTIDAMLIMLKSFDRFPYEEYGRRLKKLVQYDKAKALKGEGEYDREDD